MEKEKVATKQEETNILVFALYNYFMGKYYIINTHYVRVWTNEKDVCELTITAFQL